MKLNIFAQDYKVIALLLTNQNQIFFMYMIRFQTITKNVTAYTCQGRAIHITTAQQQSKRQAVC